MWRGKLAPVIFLVVTLLGSWQAFCPRGEAEEPGDEDTKLLKSHGIATDGPGLLAFLLTKKANEAGPEVAVAAARLLAVRQPPGAVEGLLDYAARHDDEWTRDELLASLGTLAVRKGKMDPAIVAAAQENGEPGGDCRRATATYVLGQRGGVEFRDVVRRLLDDPDASVRQAAAWGLAGKHLVEGIKETTAADAALLKENHVAAEATGLLEFLRRRTLAEGDLQEMQALVSQLGNNAHRLREEASRKLTARGAAALPFLRPVLASTDPEMVRRAKLCIEAIQRGPGPALPTAVVRQLGRLTLNQAELSSAIQILLKYVPFAEDEAVEEEVQNGLILLALHARQGEAALAAALQDAVPARRAAAAFVLARVGTRAHVLAVQRLLEDPSPSVRLRAAQGLVRARAREALPPLIAALEDAPLPGLVQDEELLHRIAGDTAPTVYVGDGSAGARRAAAAAWKAWWRQHAPTLDLAGVDLEDHRLGLMTICEYDSTLGRPGGQVWECGRDAKPRWKITGLAGPMDAQVLPGGRVLVAEHSAQRVTERDLSGAVKWEHPLNGNPVACQRLTNGNTFIATYNHVMEVSPTHGVVYSHIPGRGFYIFSAQKLRNGHIVFMTANGWFVEMESATGKQIRLVTLGHPGWCGIEALSNGKFLVALMAPGQIREVDETGKTSAQWQFPGVFRATRLPNGHTLIASMSTRKIAELDRSGRTIWEHVCEGRPWQVHWR